MRFKWVLAPVTAPMTPFTVYEHTPVYADKEFPRYLNKPGWQQPQVKWMKQYEDGRLVEPGEMK